MKLRNKLNALATAALIAVPALLTPVSAQMMGPGYSYGYGMGPGMMGDDYGYDRGYGRGYGHGYGMGPGMMGGYGPGGYGMGPGMMGGYGPYGDNSLKLSDEQRRKISDIQEEAWRKQWPLMRSMHELQLRDESADASGKFDDAEARKLYQATADLRKQMFENSLDVRKRIDAVLTKDQREQLRQGWRGGWGHR